MVIFFVRCVHQIFIFSFRAWRTSQKQTLTRENQRKEMKKQLSTSTINGERHENKELLDKSEKVEKSDELVQIINEFEYIIRIKNRNITG